MQYYEPRVTYNVNIYERRGKVHRQGCYQGNSHRTAKPDHYRDMLGRDVPSHKDPCRICLRVAIV
jgi:hypothetical protein